jgi:iron complex transport system substrate-binding protein
MTLLIYRPAALMIVLMLGLLTLLPAQSVIAAMEADSYVDATGHAVATGQDAQRIVSLAPNLTEMVFAAGLGDRLVGRTDFCNYPPAVLDVPTVGGFVDTSLEKIVALRPDLVLAAQGNSLELVEQLRQAGITVLAFGEPVEIADIPAHLMALWSVAAARSDRLPGPIHELDESFRAYIDSESGSNAGGHIAPVVFFGYPGENTLTCGSGSFLDDLISLAGGANAAHGVEGRWPIVSAEFLVATDPDWILTATPCSGSDDLAAAKAELLAELKRDPVWRSLTAVREGNVLVLDADVLLRPGPRIIHALYQLSQALEAGAHGGGGGQP